MWVASSRPHRSRIFPTGRDGKLHRGPLRFRLGVGDARKNCAAVAAAEIQLFGARKTSCRHADASFRYISFAPLFFYCIS
jgi:hypothetical protein